MLLVTLLDDGGTVAGDITLTTRETARLRIMPGIRPGSFALRLVGNDGAVKLCRETATPMTETSTLIDAMPMRQGEMADRQEQVRPPD